MDCIVLHWKVIARDVGTRHRPACVCSVFWPWTAAATGPRASAWQAAAKVADGSPTFAQVALFPARLTRPPNEKRPRERRSFQARRASSGYFLASPNLPRSVFTKRDSFPVAFISLNIAE